jgi:hypothetical protein
MAKTVEELLPVYCTLDVVVVIAIILTVIY